MYLEEVVQEHLKGNLVCPQQIVLKQEVVQRLLTAFSTQNNQTLYGDPFTQYPGEVGAYIYAAGDKLEFGELQYGQVGNMGGKFKAALGKKAVGTYHTHPNINEKICQAPSLPDCISFLEEDVFFLIAQGRGTAYLLLKGKDTATKIPEEDQQTFMKMGHDETRLTKKWPNVSGTKGDAQKRVQEFVKGIEVHFNTACQDACKYVAGQTKMGFYLGATATAVETTLTRQV
jgi:hypothetical protein